MEIAPLQTSLPKWQLVEKSQTASTNLILLPTYLIHNILSVAGVRYICGVPTAIYVM